MERIRERLTVAYRALATLQALPLGTEVSEIVRDAAIQRFETTFEAVWKAAQLFLREHEGLALASPKGVIRASFQSGLLLEEDARTALRTVEDRNLTVHTYNESLADAIYTRLPAHVTVMEKWLGAMAARIADATP